ncbi:MAG: DUF3465 domain-containing protein [Candidatus Baltobacteraceae bacterium]|jgi:hypothetical protein
MNARLTTLTVLATALGGCATTSTDSGNGAVAAAWQAHRSHVEVTASGSVARVLGTRVGPSGAHEGFLLHLRGAEGRGLTIRVEDNVDLTGPIPLRAGDDVEVHGEYIFDPRGGLVHYTHRDPRGHHPSGYVRVGGRLYSENLVGRRIQNTASATILGRAVRHA